MDRNNICKAFANEDRLRLLLCLEKAQSVTDLMGHCHLSQSALSQHLKILRDAAVVITKKEGKYVVYRVQSKKVLTIAKLLLTYQK